jgi:hypothetical protein
MCVSVYVYVRVCARLEAHSKIPLFFHATARPEKLYEFASFVFTLC